MMGDCFEKMNMIQDSSVQLILCDLPFSTKARKVTDLLWDKEMDLGKLWKEYRRILKPNGVVALHATQPFVTSLINSNPLWFKYEYIWMKSQAANFQLAKKMPLKKHEYVLIFYNKKPIYNPQMWKGEMKDKRIGRETYQKRKNETYIKTSMVNLETVKSDMYYPTTLLNFKSVPRNRSLHPTQKPVELEEFFIRTYTNENDVVVDNTMGVGSTLMAAMNTNRNGIGIEKNERYFEIAMKRLSDKIGDNKLVVL